VTLGVITPVRPVAKASTKSRCRSKIHEAGVHIRR
jgi:hypothetical protein